MQLIIILGSFMLTATFINSTNHNRKKLPSKDLLKNSNSDAKESIFSGLCKNHCVHRSCSNEQIVKEQLLCGYDRTSRPVIMDSSVTTVHIALSLFHILDTDEKHQTFAALIAVRLRWTDEHFQWNPDEYNGTKSLHMPANFIWTPDIIISNSADDNTKGFMTTNAIVQYNGKVLWMFPALIKVQCSLDVRFFPFDRQRCQTVFISWTYNGFEVDIVYNKTEDENKNYYAEANQEWNISEITAVRHVRKYACCPEPYPDITVTFFMTRRSLFYIFNLIFPCLLMYLCSFLGFFLPIESGEKVNLELTILLALVVFLLIIGDTLPPTPDAIPLLGILFGVTMIMVSVALVMGVVVTNVHIRKYTSSGLPSLLQCYIRQFYCQQHSPKAYDKVNYKRGDKHHNSQEEKYDRSYTENTRFINILLRQEADIGNEENDGIIGLKVIDEQTDLEEEPLSQSHSSQNDLGNGYLMYSLENHHLASKNLFVVPSSPNSTDARSSSSATSTKLHRGCTNNENSFSKNLIRMPSHLSLQDYAESVVLQNVPVGGRVRKDSSVIADTFLANEKKKRISEAMIQTNIDSCNEPLTLNSTLLCKCNNPESWVILAKDLDRFFFWLFGTCSIIVLTLIFAVVPDYY